MPFADAQPQSGRTTMLATLHERSVTPRDTQVLIGAQFWPRMVPLGAEWWTGSPRSKPD